MVNEQLRAARKAKRWPIALASERIGVSILTYSRWERGEQTPHLSTLDRLCQAFEMSPEALGLGHLIAKPVQLEQETLGSTSQTSKGIPPVLQGVIIPFPTGRIARHRTFQEPMLPYIGTTNDQFGFL